MKNEIPTQHGLINNDVEMQQVYDFHNETEVILEKITQNLFFFNSKPSIVS